MQKPIYVLCTALALLLSACQPDTGKQDTADATIASETGGGVPVPADALSVTRPLISGELYSKPDFNSSTLVYFDTTQHIQLLDTTGALFVKARINRNSETYTGYISKAILPELP